MAEGEEFWPPTPEERIDVMIRSMRSILDGDDEDEISIAALNNLTGLESNARSRVRESGVGVGDLSEGPGDGARSSESRVAPPSYQQVADGLATGLYYSQDQAGDGTPALGIDGSGLNPVPHSPMEAHSPDFNSLMMVIHQQRDQLRLVEEDLKQTRAESQH